MHSLLLFLVISLPGDDKYNPAKTFSNLNFEEIENRDIRERGQEILSNERFDSLNMKFVGNWPFGPSYAIEVDSARNLIFCGSGGGVYILQVSDTSNPIKLSEKIHTRGVVEGLFYQEDSQILYIAAKEVGLETWNIDDPLNSQKLGSYVTPSNAVDVTVSNNYAYVIDERTNNTTVRIIDISTPTNPSEVGYFDTPGNLEDLIVTGSYAYVADGDSGLRIIDISNPSSPSEVGFYDTTGIVIDVAISGNYAYLACGENAVKIIDISTPSDPVEVSSYDIPGKAETVEFSDNYLYLTSWSTHSHDKDWWEEIHLIIVDITNPTNPMDIRIESSSNYYPNSKGLTVSGNYAYFIAWSNLYIIDISNPSNPQKIGSYKHPAHIEDIAISESYAYGASGADGLRITDNSTPSNPIEVGSYYPPSYSGYVHSLTISGNYAYVVFDRNSLRVIDISIPSNPLKVGSYANTYACDVAVAGNYAYLLANYYGLRVIDISAPSQPIEVGAYDDITSGRLKNIAVSGNYAYVAYEDFDYDGVFLIIDISIPSNPIEIGRCYTPTHGATDVAISGNYAYLAHHDYGLLVLDISTPSNPYEVSSYVGTGKIAGVAVSDSYAYVIDNNNNDATVRIIDISTPSNLFEVGYYCTGSP